MGLRSHTPLDRPGENTRSAPTERAQSEVLGFVLLVGLTIAVIGATVAIGSVAYTSATADAEYTNVENGMSQLSSKTSLVALGEQSSRSFDLGSIQDADVHVNESQGTLRLHYVENETGIDGVELNDSTAFHTTTLGAVEYDDGSRTIAMQGGGVWKLEQGVGSIVSPPEYHYRGTTLTFPIVTVTGEDSTSGPVRGTIDSVGSQPVPDAPENPLVNGTIAVEIQSTYYEGWHQFFESRAEGSTTIDRANETVISELRHPSVVSVDFGLLVSSGSTPDVGGNADVDEIGEAALPPAQPLIDQKIDDADTESPANIDFSDEQTLTNGTYYFDSDVTIEERLSLDTSDGNITFIVDGDLTIEDEVVTVDESNNGTEYYVNGSLEATNDAYVHTIAEEPQADRNVFVVGDDVFTENAGKFGEFHAIIFAPHGEADLTGGGNSVLKGALMVDGFVNDEINTVDIQQDESLVDLNFEFDFGTTPNVITYIHVSENTVAVSFE
ncbi:MAG: DUF7289 family protein [Halobacteriota archaeon]